MNYKLYLKNDSRDEVRAWCDENLPKRVTLLTNCHINGEIVDIWYFDFKEDVMAFKLRWI